MTRITGIVGGKELNNAFSNRRTYVIHRNRWWRDCHTRIAVPIYTSTSRASYQLILPTIRPLSRRSFARRIFEIGAFCDLRFLTPGKLRSHHEHVAAIYVGAPLFAPLNHASTPKCPPADTFKSRTLDAKRTLQPVVARLQSGPS